MDRTDLNRVRLVHMERVEIALERNGCEHGLNHTLWGLGCYLYARGVVAELTPAEREFGMSHAAYALGWDAENEAFANDILSAINAGADPLAVRARKFPVRSGPPVAPAGKEAVGQCPSRSTASINRKAA